jgi:hypothetical protein
VAKIWGLTVDKWVALIQTLGVPLLFMAFVLYMAWVHVPPLVQGHVKLLERTGDTLESMDATLKQSNVILLEVGDAERDTKKFMDKVLDDHNTQCKKLDAIIDQTKKPL